MRLFFIFITFISLTLSANEDKAFLNSSDQAESHAQELLDNLKNEDALTFVQEARSLYSNSTKLLIYGGDAAFGINDIDLAKQYYQSAINIASENAIEAIVQEHIESGYVKEAYLLLEDVRGVYPQNVNLLVFSGRAAYELDDLSEAKSYYQLALELDSNNEIAALNISNIETQEEAQENKVVSGVVDYLGDKGLDFLMIFLAFLGGDLLAKRYMTCSSGVVLSSLKHYLKIKYPKVKVSGNSWKTTRVHKKLFCYFSSILNYLTISITILIIWVFFNISNDFIVTLLGVDLTTITLEDIIPLLYLSMIGILVMILTLNLLFKWMTRSNDEKTLLFEVTKELQAVALDGEFIILREACNLVRHYDVSEINCILDQCYSDEARGILEKAFLDVSDQYKESMEKNNVA